MLPWLRRVLRNDMRAHGLFEEALNDAEEQIDEMERAEDKHEAEVESLHTEIEHQKIDIDIFENRIKALEEQIRELTEDKPTVTISSNVPVYLQPNPEAEARRKNFLRTLR